MKMFATTVLAAGALVLTASSVSAQGVNDAQIASIVVTANQVDIDAGKLAATKATQRRGEGVRAADGHGPYRRQQAGGRRSSPS